jgi:very-short-patch-repair endonuclease
MNALIDLGKCREYITVNIGDKSHEIKLSGAINEPYFDGNDTALTLGYKNPKKALLTHVKPKHKKELSQLLDKNMTYNEGKAVYINKRGLEELISKSRLCGPDKLQKLVEAFDLNLSITPRKEQEHFEAIFKSFPDVEKYTQFKVGTYRVDMYMEDYDLVIECDEFNHRDRDPQKERQREEFIKSELNCDFIRFNPDKKNFSVFEVIASIHKFILNKVTREKDETIKKYKHKNKLLKAQLKEQ